jgi:hypothetical protein
VLHEPGGTVELDDPTRSDVLRGHVQVERVDLELVDYVEHRVDIASGVRCGACLEMVGDSAAKRHRADLVNQNGDPR